MHVVENTVEDVILDVLHLVASDEGFMVVYLLLDAAGILGCHLLQTIMQLVHVLHSLWVRRTVEIDIEIHVELFEPDFGLFTSNAFLVEKTMPPQGIAFLPSLVNAMQVTPPFHHVMLQQQDRKSNVAGGDVILQLSSNVHGVPESLGSFDYQANKVADNPSQGEHDLVGRQVGPLLLRHLFTSNIAKLQQILSVAA